MSRRFKVQEVLHVVAVGSYLAGISDVIRELVRQEFVVLGVQ